MKKLICLIIFIIAANNNFAQNLDSGLIGKWLFTGNALDSSSYGNHGIVYKANLTQDRFGRVNNDYNFTYDSAVFGQRNCEIYVPYNSVFNVNKISVAVWIYPISYYWTGNSIHSSIIISRFQYGYSNPNGEVWGIGFEQTNTFAWLDAGTNNQTRVYAPPLQLNAWSLVVFTYDGTNMKLYINDSLKGTTPYSGAMNISGNSGISIGELNSANGYWYYTNGKIDDVRIYNRALTHQEIKLLFYPVPSAPSLVSPSNGGTNLAPNVLLDWNAVQYASSYRVQIANDSLFTSLVKDTSSVVQDSLRISPGILLSNVKYYWRVNATNISGTGIWSSVWNFRINQTGINQIGYGIPEIYSLEQNYPNPFNPVTKIRFAVTISGFITLKVFDILGKEIATLVNESLQPGIYETTFDASNLSTGIYFYRLRATGFTENKRMVLIK